METPTETALVKITTIPIKDPVYERLVVEVQSLCQHINNAVVDSPEAVMRITTDADLGRQLVNRLKDKHKEYKEEPLRVCKQIDAAFKLLTDPLEAATANRTGIAARKITAFKVIQEERQRTIDAENARIKREQEELQRMIDEENIRLRLEAEKATTIDKYTGEIIEPVVEYIKPEPAPVFTAPVTVVGKASTFAGSSTAKMVPEWRVVNFAILPDRFKMEKTSVLKYAIEKANERDIPGVEIVMVAVTDFRAGRSK